MERTSEEIREKIERVKRLIHNPEFGDMAKGCISALYWVLKETNPYTGVNFGSE